VTCLCHAGRGVRPYVAQVGYRERMAAVGRMPSTATRNEHGESAREAATADAIERVLAALLPPGYAAPMQARRGALVP